MNLFEIIANVMKWYFQSLVVGMDIQTLGCIFFHAIAVLMTVAYVTQRDRHFRLVLGFGSTIFMASSLLTIGHYILLPIFSTGTGGERIVAFITANIVEFILATIIYFRIVDQDQPVI